MAGGRVRFEKVSFSYDETKPALHEVSLEAPAGKTVALVGASGAGKSTVLNLIARFYDPDAGRVTIDEQDLRHVTLDSLRGRSEEHTSELQSLMRISSAVFCLTKHNK